MKKAFLNWSSGKDSAYALYLVEQQKEFSIKRLITTINRELDRVSMHGLRKELLLQQADSLGMPLQLIQLSGNASMAEYDEQMFNETKSLQLEGFEYSLFGDIFLEDLREYREQQLQKVDLKAVFPLWGIPTADLMQNILDLGFKAITVSVNSRLLDKSYCGRIIDEEFISQLPAGVDPAGENGEFHSFVFDGPNFREPVRFEKGEVVEKTYPSAKKKDDNCFSDKKKSWDNSFWYCDLLPK